jgi:hypothetical protein
VDPGDLSSRLELKKRAKHNFSWFLKHVYPQLGLYDVSSLAYGRVSTNGSVNNLVCVCVCVCVLLGESGLLQVFTHMFIYIIYRYYTVTGCKQLQVHVVQWNER